MTPSGIAISELPDGVGAGLVATIKSRWLPGWPRREDVRFLTPGGLTRRRFESGADHNRSVSARPPPMRRGRAEA
jgi:hypothetical protein